MRFGIGIERLVILFGCLRSLEIVGVIRFVMIVRNFGILMFVFLR